jgi:hypothetical protein
MFLTCVAVLVFHVWNRFGKDGDQFQGERKHDCMAVLRDTIKGLKKPQLRMKLISKLQHSISIMGKSVIFVLG